MTSTDIATAVAPGFAALVVLGRPIDALDLARSSEAPSGDLLFAVTSHIVAAALAYAALITDGDHDPAQFLNYLAALPVGLESQDG